MWDAVWKPLLKKSVDAEASAFAESSFAGNAGESVRDPVPLVGGIWPVAIKDGLYHHCCFLLGGGKTNRLLFRHSQLVFFSISIFVFNCTAVQERGRLTGCRQMCSDTAPAWGPAEAVALLGEHCWPGRAGWWFGCEGATLQHSCTAGQSRWGGLKGKWMSCSYLSTQDAAQRYNICLKAGCVGDHLHGISDAGEARAEPMCKACACSQVGWESPLSLLFLVFTTSMLK